MIKLAHGLSNPPRPDSIIGFVKLTTSPSAPLVSTLCHRPFSQGAKKTQKPLTKCPSPITREHAPQKFSDLYAPSTIRRPSHQFNCFLAPSPTEPSRHFYFLVQACSSNSFITSAHSWKGSRTDPEISIITFM